MNRTRTRANDVIEEFQQLDAKNLKAIKLKAKQERQKLIAEQKLIEDNIMGRLFEEVRTIRKTLKNDMLSQEERDDITFAILEILAPRDYRKLNSVRFNKMMAVLNRHGYQLSIPKD